MTVIRTETAERWLKVNGWERLPVSRGWTHPDHARDRSLSCAVAVEWAMLIDVERATIPLEKWGEGRP